MGDHCAGPQEVSDTASPVSLLSALAVSDTSSVAWPRFLRWRL